MVISWPCHCLPSTGPYGLGLANETWGGVGELLVAPEKVSQSSQKVAMVRVYLLPLAAVTVLFACNVPRGANSGMEQKRGPGSLRTRCKWADALWLFYFEITVLFYLNLSQGPVALCCQRHANHERLCMLKGITHPILIWGMSAYRVLPSSPRVIRVCKVVWKGCRKKWEK